MLTRCLDTLPRTLKIGAYDWLIVLDAAVNDEQCGEADFEQHTISLWTLNLKSPDHVAGITLHECLHVMFDNAELGTLPRDKDKREEKIVMGFEIGLVSLLRDNPKFVTWLKRWL